MEKLERTLRYVALYNIYRGLLTYTQQEIAGDYFLADLSLSEIADNRKISRSAVEDAIQKSCKKMDEFEQNLKVLERKEKLLKISSKLKEKALNTTEINDIEQLEKELDYGI